MRRRPRQAGFTLLEVMIASVLLAVMMTLLLAGMRLGADSWEQGERLAERATRMLVADNFFRSHLSDVKPLFDTSANALGVAGAPARLLFRGGPDFLEYAGTLPPQVRGGMYKFRLYFVQEDGRSDLKLALRPFSPTAATDEPIEDVLVLENVESLRFSYYKVSNVQNEPSRWVEQWQENSLPALVRVEIVLAGEPAWPPILVTPHAETGQ